MQPKIYFKERIIVTYSVAKLVSKALKISLDYRIRYKMSIEELISFNQENLLLAFAIPELQPKYEYFDKEMVKFVGSCIAENTRLNGDTFDILDENQFEKKNYREKVK